jgi:hypothetical protein
MRSLKSKKSRPLPSGSSLSRKMSRAVLWRATKWSCAYKLNHSKYLSDGAELDSDIAELLGEVLQKRTGDIVDDDDVVSRRPANSSSDRLEQVGDFEGLLKEGIGTQGHSRDCFVVSVVFATEDYDEGPMLCIGFGLADLFNDRGSAEHRQVEVHDDRVRLGLQHVREEVEGAFPIFGEIRFEPESLQRRVDHKAIGLVIIGDNACQA